MAVSEIKALWGNQMTYSPANNRCLHLGCAAVVATAITVAVGAPQLRNDRLPGESNPAQIEVALTSATVTTASRNADATQDPVRGILGVGLGLAIAPFWYVGLPVTLPYMFVTRVDVLMRLGFDLPNAVGAAIPLSFVAWLAGPFTLAGELINGFGPANSAAALPRNHLSASSVTSTARPAGNQVRKTAAPTQRKLSAVSDTDFRRVTVKPAAAKSKRAPGSDVTTRAAVGPSKSRSAD